ncbi:BapA/Bap/LapF family prefix-like domain-containing protein [Ruegeria atlantica]|uniref:BapA/Bap/LapF family prefix-like domain-containing protein n=1 Tax=Ruegeria atlantica TaxID=81569 RepID=UPI00147EF39B|nr:hypothetical protein [Ruegeria atlantica]
MSNDSAFIANMSELNESGSGQLIRLPAGAFGAVLPVASQSIEAALRDGADLVIVLQSGHQIRIDGFFAEDGRVLVLRDPETGEFFEARLSLDGQMIGVEPRSRDELSELFQATPGEVGALDAAYANDSMAFADPVVSEGAMVVGAATGARAISTGALIAGAVAIGAIASETDDDDPVTAPIGPASQSCCRDETGHWIVTYEYDAIGNMVRQKIDLNGDGVDDVIIAYEYDVIGNVTRQAFEINGHGKADAVEYFETDAEANSLSPQDVTLSGAGVADCVLNDEGLGTLSDEVRSFCLWIDGDRINPMAVTGQGTRFAGTTGIEGKYRNLHWNDRKFHRRSRSNRYRCL